MKKRTYFIICVQKGKRPADDDPIVHQHTDAYESQKMLGVLKRAEENGGAKVYSLTRYC